MKRKLTGIEKHVRTWARRRIKFTKRELANLDAQIKRTRSSKDLRTLRVLRISLKNLLESNKAWAEARL